MQYENQNQNKDQEYNEHGPDLESQQRAEILDQREHDITNIMNERELGVHDLVEAYKGLVPQVALSEGAALLHDMNAQVYHTIAPTFLDVRRNVNKTARALNETLPEHEQSAVRLLHDEVLEKGVRNVDIHAKLGDFQDPRPIMAIIDNATIVRYRNAVRDFGPNSLEAHDTAQEASTDTLRRALHAAADGPRMHGANVRSARDGVQDPRVMDELDGIENPTIRAGVGMSMDYRLYQDARRKMSKDNVGPEDLDVKAIVVGASSPRARDLIAGLIGDPNIKPRPSDFSGIRSPHENMVSPLEAATLRRRAERAEAVELARMSAQRRSRAHQPQPPEGPDPEAGNGGRRPNRLRRAVYAAAGAVAVLGAVVAGAHIAGGSSSHAEHGKGRVAATASRTPHHAASVHHKAAPTAATVYAYQDNGPIHSALPKSDMETPLSPQGGEWKLAEEAVWDAGEYGNNNYAFDDATVKGIRSSTVRKAAQYAVQSQEASAIVSAVVNGPSGPVPKMSELTIPSIRQEVQTTLDYTNADTAALDATQEEYSAANALLPQIKSSQLANEVRTVIRDEQAGNDTAATSIWYNIDNTAVGYQAHVYDAATNQWMQVDRHTTQYAQEYKDAPNKK